MYTCTAGDGKYYSSRGWEIQSGMGNTVEHRTYSRVWKKTNRNRKYNRGWELQWGWEMQSGIDNNVQDGKNSRGWEVQLGICLELVLNLKINKFNAIKSKVLKVQYPYLFGPYRSHFLSRKSLISS
jgi:hypothetical protein